MSTRNGGCFDGATSLLDIHNSGTWFSQFSPIIEGRKKRIAEALLHLRHVRVMVGDFAMYIGGILADHPGIITIHRLSPAKVVSWNFRLISTTPAFSFDKLDFLYMANYSRPGSIVFYTVRFGNEITALRIAIVNSVKPCGPRSSINFTQYKWQTFAYHIRN